MTSNINYFWLMKENINIHPPPPKCYLLTGRMYNWPVELALSGKYRKCQSTNNLAKKAFTPITQHTTESNYNGHDYIYMSNGIHNSLRLIQF
jgi:hypothetical protein